MGAAAPADEALAAGLDPLEELLGLHWDSVDVEAKTVTVRRSVTYAGGEVRLKEPKTKRGRRVVELATFCLAPWPLTARTWPLRAGWKRRCSATARAGC